MARRRLVRLFGLLAALILGSTVVWAVWPRQAAANLALLCGSSSAAANPFSGAFSADVTFTDASGTTYVPDSLSGSAFGYGSGFDLDDDGVNDGLLALDAWTNLPFVSNDAIAYWNAFTNGPDVVSAIGGPDYLSLASSSPDFTQIAVKARLSQLNPTDDPSEAASNWPEGTIGISITLERQGGDLDEYSFEIDTTGASASGHYDADTSTDFDDNPWPQLVDAMVFLDTHYANLAALGLTTWAGSGSGAVQEPWSNMGLKVNVEKIDANPMGIEAELGHSGAYTGDGAGNDLSIGTPGESSIVAMIDCAVDAPQNVLGIGYESHASDATLIPPSFDGHIEVAGDGDADGDGDLLGDVDDRTIYADFSVSEPPSWLKIDLSDANVDLDADGADDGLDLDADAVNDALPWNRVQVSHANDTDAGIEGVVALTPLNSAKGDTYAAVQAGSLPEWISFDMAGIPEGNGIDDDGDGYDDDAEAPMTYASLAFCERDFSTVTTWATDWPASCISAVEAADGISLHVGNELPALDTDGNVPAPSSYGEFDDAPAAITATEGDHFAATADNYVIYTADDSAAEPTWSVAGTISDVTSGSLDRSNDIHATIAATSTSPLGAEIHLTSQDSSTTDVWAILEDLPNAVTLDLDTEDMDVDGDPIQVDLDAGADTINAAIDVDMATAGGVERQTQVQGWIDGLPGNASIDLDFEGNQRSADYTAAGTMDVDVGLTTSSADDRTAGYRTMARLAATVPQELAFDYDLFGGGSSAAAFGDIDNLALSGCVTSSFPSCPTIDDIKVAAERSAGAADDSALGLAFDTGFAANPEQIDATSAGHFAPAPPHWGTFSQDRNGSTDPLHQLWGATAQLSGLQRAVMDAEPDGAMNFDLTTSGITQFGIDARLVNETGSVLDAWAVLEDLPDTITVAADVSDTADDGDPIALVFDLVSSTSAAFAVDSASVASDAAETHMAGWIGTAAGGDGLPAGTTAVEMSSDSGSNYIEYQGISSMAVDAGLTTSKQDDRDEGDGYRTRLHASAVVPPEIRVEWETDSSDALQSVAATTCVSVTTGCPTVDDIYLIADRGPGNADDGALTLPFDATWSEPRYQSQRTDIANTQVNHFDPSGPPHFAEYASFAGADATNVRDDEWTASAVLTGLETVMFDTSDGIDVGVTTQGMEKFGVDASMLDHDGYETHLAGVLADLPDEMSVKFKPVDVNGDDVADEFTAGFEFSDRTAAALTFDQIESDGSSKRQRTHGVGWIGTGDGKTDGVPSRGRLYVDLYGEGREAVWQANGSIALDLGLTSTRDDDDREAGIVMQGHMSATIPEALNTFWRIEDDAFDRLEFTTCREDPLNPGSKICAPVSGIDARIVQDTVLEGVDYVAEDGATAVPVLDYDTTGDGYPDTDHVEMVKIPDNASNVFYDQAGSPASGDDFLLAPEYLHLVVRNDPLGEDPQGGDDQSGGSDDGDDDPDEASGASNDVRTLGAEIRLEELSSIGYSHSMPWFSLFNQHDLCLSAKNAATTPTMGLGFYSDNGLDTDGQWLNAGIDHYGQQRSLGMQLQADIPWNEALNESMLGTMNQYQEVLATYYPFMQFTRDSCPEFSGDHSEDPAPITYGGQDVLGELSLQFRSGIRNTIDELFKLEGVHGDKIGLDDWTGSVRATVPNPGTFGIDAAMHTAKQVEGDPSSAADVAARIKMPGRLTAEQPDMKTCSESGNQDPETCMTAEAYNTTKWSDISFDFESDSPEFGDLDVLVFMEGEDEDSDDGETTDAFDQKAMATLVDIPTLPESFEIAAHMEQRARDNGIFVDASLRASPGTPWGDISVSLYDDYAENLQLGDDSEYTAGTVESLDANLNPPMARFDIQNVTNELNIEANVVMPQQGWPDPDKHNDDDCDDFEAPSDPDHMNVDPATVSVDGPRDAETDTIRSPYVHAELDMANSARDLSINVDGRDRVDTDFSKLSAILQPARWGFIQKPHYKIWLETDTETSGDVQAFFAPLQFHVEEEAAGGIVDAEICIDVDIPAHIEWDDASRFSLGLDMLKATMTMDDAEVAAGADATMAFGESVWQEAGIVGDPTDDTRSFVEGIWAHELFTRVHFGFANYVSMHDGERKTVGIIDPENATNNFSSLPQTYATMSDFKASGAWWAEGTATDSSGDKAWASFFPDLLFDAALEAHMATASGIITTWDSLWETFLNSVTDYQINADCAAGSCGAYTVHGNSPWEIPQTSAVLISDVGMASLSSSSVGLFGTQHDLWSLSDRMSDGSYFRVHVFSGGSGRVHIYLECKYANGYTRWVRKLVDTEVASTLTNWHFEIEIDVIPDNSGRVEVDFWAARQGVLNTDEIKDLTFEFDMAGNGSEPWKTLAVSDASGDGAISTGEMATFSNGHDADDLWWLADDNTCYWYPGDGTVYDDEDDGDGAIGQTSFTYTFPGEYQVTQQCYRGYFSEWPYQATTTIVVQPANITASATASPLSGKEPVTVYFDASLSSSDAGEITQFEWDWDGDDVYDDTTTSPYMTHSYTEGTYEPQMRITDATGQTARAMPGKIVVDPPNVAPTADASVSPSVGDAPLEVNADASASADSDGTIDVYEWDWGDGSALDYGETATHTYATAGLFTGTLSVTDSDGATDSDTFSVVVHNGSPTADFSVTPGTGEPGVTVFAFDASSSHDPDGTLVSYEWDFDGDGTYDATETSAYAIHTYAATGSYTPVLQVTDDAGDTDTYTLATPIEVSDAPNVDPVAAFTVTPSSGDKPLDVAADASLSSDTDGTIADYAWSWGDGTPDENGTSPTATHTYGSSVPAGTVTITLTVTDDDGATHSATETVTLTEPPAAADTVTVTLSGGVSYTNTATLTGGDYNVNKDSYGRVISVSGTGTFPSTVSGDAGVAINASKIGFLSVFFGSIRVQDPAAGIYVNTPIFFASLGTGTGTGTNEASGSHSWILFSSFPWRSYNIAWVIDDIA